MVIVLALLAVLMIAVGSAAVLNGWDMVLNERGWTQVIAGATLATGGLLLIGLACVAAELRRMRRELMTAVMDVPGDDLPASASPQTTLPPRIEPPPASAPDSDRNDDGPASGPTHSPRTAPLTHPNLSDGQNPSPEGVPPEQNLSSVNTLSAVQDLAAIGAPPVVVGTYASNGITYFMFSDNSIEAEMAQGRFRFESMDELRQYIETGEGGFLVTPAENNAKAESGTTHP